MEDVRAESPTHVRYGANTPTNEAVQAANPVAVLVCHGMGQQVRYETISAVANAVLQEAATAGGTSCKFDIHLFQQDERVFTRAEISWKDPRHVQHAAHVYEAYWAPLTEGRVTYWDTITFLLLAAWNGLRYSKLLRAATFRRWMFGAPQPLTIGALTFASIVMVVLFLLAQVAAIAFVSVSLAGRYKQFLSAVPAFHIHGLLRTLLLWIAPLFAGGNALMNEPPGAPEWWRGGLHLVLWLALIAEVLVARYFIVQFVGDVAAYISPYKSSKFDELRQKIQTVGLDVGKIIYGFGGPAAGVPTYERVVVVGHSLGSVLAYDTLNALINLDNVAPAPDKRHVARRTTSLITFGSPLDKTAFIFRMQPDDEQDWFRERLAASAQPLILDYAAYRPNTFAWTNLWSPMDVISGSLEYYDAVPATDPRHVRNEIDPQARVPLMAHTQYWNGRRLRHLLYGACS